LDFGEEGGMEVTRLRRPKLKVVPPVQLLGSVDAVISQVMAALSVEATAGVTLSAASLVIAAQTLTQCALNPLRPLRVSNVLVGRSNTIPT